MCRIIHPVFFMFIYLYFLWFRRDLDTYSENHLSGCNLVDPDLNGGELNIKIPTEVRYLSLSFYLVL